MCLKNLQVRSAHMCSFQRVYFLSCALDDMIVTSKPIRNQNFRSKHHHSIYPELLKKLPDDFKCQKKESSLRYLLQFREEKFMPQSFVRNLQNFHWNSGLGFSPEKFFMFFYETRQDLVTKGSSVHSRKVLFQISEDSFFILFKISTSSKAF